MRVPTDDIIRAYRETGSVWKAAKRVGLAGQSVHERLVAVGYPLASRRWRTDELDELASLVAANVPLAEIGRRLGRPYAGVAAKASRLGIRSQCGRRERPLPRGAGYDKISTRRHLVALEHYGGSITQYARANGLSVDSLVGALERHFPDRWKAYARTHSKLPEAICPYCGQGFIPNNGKQKFCTRKCGADSARDERYFGGRRREAIGLTAGVCQLCGQTGKKGLSAHHVVGKENDPDDAALIALCRGCHQLVTQLGARRFANDPAAWEALISLAWLRRNGSSLPDGADTLHVTVQIESYEDEQEAAA